jgi:hypothetical protein
MRNIAVSRQQTAVTDDNGPIFRTVANRCGMMSSGKFFRTLRIRGRWAAPSGALLSLCLAYETRGCNLELVSQAALPTVPGPLAGGFLS